MNYQDALNFHKAGFSVVPALPKRKRPAVHLVNKSWRRFQSIRPTVDDLKGWFSAHEDLNLAVICGEVSNGVYVLDFDFNSRDILPKWFELAGAVGDVLPVVQTGKGYHLYFRYPDQLSSGILAKADKKILIELRGENTLCMLAGSTHENGKAYRWIRGDERTIPILTTRQVYLLLGSASQLNIEKERIYVPKSQPIESSISKQDAYAMKALNSIACDLSGLDSGRNNALNGSAYRLGRFVGSDLLPRSLVENKLRWACEQNGYIAKDGELAFVATMNSGLSAGERNPV